MKKNSKLNDLAQQTAATQMFRRMIRGIRVASRNPKYLLILLCLLAPLLVVWLNLHAIFGYSAASPFSKLNDLLFTLLLVIAGLIICCIFFLILGNLPIAISIENNLLRIGFVNSAGEPPTFLSKRTDKDNPHITFYDFYTIGLPVSAWLDYFEKIQAALNITICSIQQGKDNHHIQLKAAPPATSLPTLLPWNNIYRPISNSELALGESVLGPVTVDLSKIPHILLGGSTGSGKSGLLRVLLFQSLQIQDKVYIADFKGGVDFTGFWEEYCTLCYKMDDLLNILDHFVKELEARKKLLRDEKCANIDSYNCHGHLPGNRPLHRMIFACDEVAAILDKTGRSKEQKEQIDKAVDRLSLIAQQGRAFGLHLILSTQRPDANLIPGQIRSNIDCKVCGRADSVLSSIIIDSTAAADLIPKDAQGRFILNDGAAGINGTVFQAYWLDNPD